MSSVIRKAVTGRSSEELIALLSSVAFTIIGALLIAALYFGREIFVPLALAILLSFVLAPVVGLLQRIRVPRGLAVVSVVVLAFIAIFGLGSLVAQQLTQLAGDLPRYEATMREKIKSVRGATASSGTLERAADMLQELSKELDKPKDAKSNKDDVSERQRLRLLNLYRSKCASQTLEPWKASAHSLRPCSIRWRQLASSSSSSFLSCFSERICEIVSSGSQVRMTCSGPRRRSTMRPAASVAYF